jgi:hypothetical protein
MQLVISWGYNAGVLRIGGQQRPQVGRGDYEPLEVFVEALALPLEGI